MELTQKLRSGSVTPLWLGFKFKQHVGWLVVLLLLTLYNIYAVDIFFVVQLYDTLNRKIYSLIMFGSALLFVLLPIFSNFLQLHKSIQEWVTDIETRKVVQAWVQMHLRALYAMCILFGSAFTAIEICNSNLFSLSVFNMGLNRRQKALFKNQRVFSTVLLEVE